jgi:hypothetical protein
MLIAAKIFLENFLIDDRCYQVFPQLKHNFLTSFCQLKYCGFELSSLIWKLYLQMDMLFWEIYSEIFSCMICMSLFSHNNHKWKLFVLSCYLTRAINTEQSTIQRSFCNTWWSNTHSVIGSLLKESSSVCWAHPWYVQTRNSEKLRAHLISLHNEHLILWTCLKPK